jgi:hypothetical protein
MSRTPIDKILDELGAEPLNESGFDMDERETYKKIADADRDVA